MLCQPRLRLRCVKREITREEHILWLVSAGSTWRCFDPKFKFFTDEAWFHLSGYNDIHNNSYRSGVNGRQSFEVPLYDQKNMCGVPLLLHERKDPIFSKTLFLNTIF
jgi:hypothetical protein